MRLYKYLPVPSDRMGLLWTLGSIKDICIVEYGPAGTTHYAMESLMRMNAELRAGLYTTDMDESEVVMGDTSRLETTIREVDQMYRPSVICVVGSSLVAVTGIDLKGVCHELQPEIAARLIAFESGGFQGDYPVGIREGLRILAEEAVKPPLRKEARTYNIIGCTIDMYNFAADLRELERLMERAFGYRLGTVFTAGTALPAIETAAAAEFNLVLRSEGLAAAKVLQERYGQHYVVGCPYGLKGTVAWLEKVGAILGRKPDTGYLAEETAVLQPQLFRQHMALFPYRKLQTVLAGAYDFLTEFAPFLVEELGLELTVLIVNHQLGAADRHGLSQALRERLIAVDQETAVDTLLKETRPQLVLGDGMLITRVAANAIKIQVSNPNLDRILLYEHTPWVGFRGVTYLIERLLNEIHVRGSGLPARGSGAVQR